MATWALFVRKTTGTWEFAGLTDFEEMVTEFEESRVEDDDVLGVATVMLEDHETKAPEREPDDNPADDHDWFTAKHGTERY